MYNGLFQKVLKGGVLQKKMPILLNISNFRM